MSEIDVIEGRKPIAQAFRSSTRSLTFSLLEAFDSGLHRCIKPTKTWKVWMALLGKICSIAILFRVVHSAHARLANKSMPKRFGKLQFLLQIATRSSQDPGCCAKPNASPTPAHRKRAKEHLKKMWSTFSGFPQRQQRWLPFQPLRFKAVAVCSLSLLSCHKKTLIFRGVRTFQQLFESFSITPLLVMKE